MLVSIKETVEVIVIAEPSGAERARAYNASCLPPKQKKEWEL